MALFRRSGSMGLDLQEMAPMPRHRAFGPDLSRPTEGPPGKEDDPGGPGDPGDGGQTGVVTQTRPKTKKPSMYRVLMLNDDYTPMEFVVHVLQRFFNMSHDDSVKIMLHVHQRGVGVCGIYTYEVAETKVTQVIDFARKHEHPLQCTLEKE
ncbi:MAG: ATP-dependent Clp protease adapter ClpS [Alphaproteobacteria bacterium]|nr:ATP-dependent Clp protease adapter ClpS [Alphaproteobacteria bacterium]